MRKGELHHLHHHVDHRGQGYTPPVSGLLRGLENLPGNFDLCRNPLSICSIPTDWLANRSLFGSISSRCEVSLWPGEMILNVWRLDVKTYGGTISPGRLTGIYYANGYNQGCSDVRWLESE